MRRQSSSDSLGGLISICPATDEHSPRNGSHVYGREFQSMLDGLDEDACIEESGQKKRRLSVDQVKALEKNFEVGNKPEPERKVKLAQELGLQPRQVAVWFQNRRARWKIKQLETDYGVLKANYEDLKVNYDALQNDNEALLKEIRELKKKLEEENTESNVSVKEEIIITETEEKGSKEAAVLVTGSETKDVSNGGILAVSLLPDCKDGSSDSDSSAIFNEENNNNNNQSPISSGVLQTHLMMSHSRPSSSSSPPFQFTKMTPYQTQFVKMEEHNSFSSEEACDFFSVEQPPTLHWYCSDPDQWNN